MISSKKIEKAVETIRAAAHPVRIILFGSYATGNFNDESDLDLLVVEREVKEHRMEIVRLRRLLSPLRIPVDIIVISERSYNEWKGTSGNIIYEASRNGKVVYEAS